MRLFKPSACIAALLATTSSADTNGTKLSSKQILPNTFKPPAVFENVNLVRTLNLERIYPRETINVAIRNIGQQAEEYYYIPFEGDVISRIGGVTARDKSNAEAPPLEVEQVEYDPYSSTQYYRITLPQPLASRAEQTLTLTYYTLSALHPLPPKIAQDDQQHLTYTTSAYHTSVYPTLKQKTKIRFPSGEVTDYTRLPSPASSNAKSGVKSENTEDPVKDGKSYTYGPFSSVPAGTVEPIMFRYEYTHPLAHIDLLERDVEISHWGGSIATEERFWLLNRAAALKGQFSRVQWQQAAYYNPPTVALKALWMPLAPEARGAYFIDDVGNVSTSRWAQGDVGRGKQSVLDLRPRFPVFGGWRFKFRVGWEGKVEGVLRRLRSGGGFVLRVPFLEGPKEREGVEYDRVVTRIILPEGAVNVKFETSVPLVGSEITTHRTFLDTKGRTALVLTAMNLIDETRTQDVFVTYEYSLSAALRKPITITSAVFSIFIVAWLVGKADVRIKG